jgi:surface antigen
VSNLVKARTAIVLLPIMVALSATFTVIAGTARPVFAGKDTYPAKWAPPTPMDSVYDDWGELNRECTSYAAWMLHSVNGFKMPFSDDAANWGPDARNLKYTVNMFPGLGSIFWKSSPQHVGWVESISSDGRSITYEDYNFDYTGHWGEHTVATSSASGYIHFEDLITYQYHPVAADFNGDGHADIGLRNASNGVFYIKHGPGFNDQTSYQWVAGTNYQAFAADFSGDGHADIGLRDASNGVFYIKHGPGFNDQTSYQWAAGTNYQAFAADFNGDGHADIGLRDASNGVFYIKHGPGFNDQTSYQWVSG